MSHTRAQYAATHVQNAMALAGIQHSKHAGAVSDALASPIVGNLFNLMDDGSPAAAADGDDQLKATLATVLGLCTLVGDHVTGSGGTPDPFLAKTTAALTTLLTP